MGEELGEKGEKDGKEGRKEGKRKTCWKVKTTRGLPSTLLASSSFNFHAGRSRWTIRYDVVRDAYREYDEFLLFPKSLFFPLSKRLLRFTCIILRFLCHSSVSDRVVNSIRGHAVYTTLWIFANTSLPRKFGTLISEQRIRLGYYITSCKNKFKADLHHGISHYYSLLIFFFISFLELRISFFLSFSLFLSFFPLNKSRLCHLARCTLRRL